MPVTVSARECCLCRYCSAIGSREAFMFTRSYVVTRGLPSVQPGRVRSVGGETRGDDSSQRSLPRSRVLRSHRPWPWVDVLTPLALAAALDADHPLTVRVCSNVRTVPPGLPAGRARTEHQVRTIFAGTRDDGVGHRADGLRGSALLFPWSVRRPPQAE